MKIPLSIIVITNEIHVEIGRGVVELDECASQINSIGKKNCLYIGTFLQKVFLLVTLNHNKFTLSKH